MTPKDLGLPFDRFRSYDGFSQFEAAVEIAADKNRFFLFRAPPGSGKSLINFTVSKLLGYRTLYLVVTKHLQDQLMEDFGPIGLVDIRGHSNYSCGKGGYSESPGPRPLIPSSRMKQSSDAICSRPSRCEWKAAVEKARQSQYVETSYALWLTLDRNFQSDILGQFDLVILDEAHNAPDWLSRFTSFTLQSTDTRRLLGVDVPSPDSDWVSWSKEAVELARSHEATKPSETTRKELRVLVRNLRRLLEATEHFGTEWIIEKTHGRRVVITPVWPGAFGEQALHRGAKKVILSSATQPKSTAFRVGASKSKTSFMDLPSGFPASNRPFYFVTGKRDIRVVYTMTSGEKTLLVRRIDQIIENRLDRKGIIPAASYHLAREILERSKFADLFIHHTRGRSKTAIQKFKKSKGPRILLSPSIREGVDFPGDECRYIIIPKVPYPDMRSPLMSARRKSDKSYAYDLVSQGLEQMVGRGTRSKSDWCESFILDAQWRWLYNKGDFSKSFKDTWRIVTNPPKPMQLAA